jgi:peptidoglycan-associated lipoprotein
MKYFFIFISLFLVSCAPKYTAVQTKTPSTKAYDIKPVKIVDVNDLNLDMTKNQGEGVLQNSSEYLAPLSVPEPNIRNQKFEQNFDLKVIYFDYDSYDVKEEYINSVKENAAWFKKHQEYNLLIEGYTDQMGTNEYNIVLGQQRASSMRAYLSYLGVDPKRIATISYGEEKLAVKEETEADSAKNRRVEFLLFKPEQK